MKKYIALGKILAAQWVAQLVLLAVGSAPSEACLTVSFLSVLAPLYSRRVLALYKLALTAFSAPAAALAQRR